MIDNDFRLETKIARIVLTSFWKGWYSHPENDMCVLCGQSGVIDTTGLITPAGTDVGGKHFCICPNGQALRDGNSRAS